MKKIKVYGKLRKIVGQAEFVADISSPFEALSFLNCNFKGIEEHMALQPYQIICGDLLITEEIINLKTDQIIKIVPMAHGNFFSIFIGAALKWGAKKFAAKTIFGSVLKTIGTQLLFSGINSLLSPQRSQTGPSGMSQEDPAAFAANYSFTGLTNVSQAGVPVNLVFGEILTGSINVSNGIDTVQVEGGN